MIVIISGPSASGKTTLVKALIASTDLPMRRAITYTTRSPRFDEKHAVDYYFVSEKEFEESVLNGEFIETAIVHGYNYGTPVSELIQTVDEIVILIIDVEGFKQIKPLYKEMVSFFIVTSEYKERLLKRETNTEIIRARLKTAKKELKSILEYDFVVVNDDISEALVEIGLIIQDAYDKYKI